MFGYIRPVVGELKVKEHEFYRAAYCGLCRALGNKSSFLSLTLSYDFVFLAIVRMAVEGDGNSGIAFKRCVAHPLKKRAYLKSNPSLEHTASSAALLLYYNLLDDINDSRGMKKFISKLCLPKAKKLRKKNLGDGELDALIKKELDILAGEEKKESGSIYDCAEPFGRLLGHVFSYGITKESDKRCLFTFGRYIGRWIYITDALDDLEEDEKNGTFNRLLADRKEREEDFKKNITDALILELAEAEKVLDLLSIEDSGLLNIIHNILYLGMPECAKKAASGEKKKRKHKKGDHI